MKLKLILIVLLTSAAVSNEACAQKIEGDWYTPLRNKLLHIIISKDSIIFRKCSFDSDMRDYGYADMAFRVEKAVSNTLIVSATKDSLPTFYVLSFKLKNGRNYLNIESLNTTFKTMIDAENAVTLIEQQPMSITLLDKSAIDKTRQQKEIATMTTNDFKPYALRIIELDSVNSTYQNKKYKLSYLYIESTGRIILSDLGFNSLVKGSTFDSMIGKFAENTATKELYMKMAKAGK